MRLVELYVKDFCQYEEVTVSLLAGMNIVVGENGSGKSNLFVRAPEFAMFGECANTPRLEENIRGYDRRLGNSPVADEATVRLRFIADGKEGVVTRVIRSEGANRALMVYDNETYKSVSKVNAKMQDLLQVDPRMASRFVIVHQGRLDALFSATRADRKDMFHLLFGTNIFDRFARGMSTEISNYDVFKVPDETPEQLQDEMTVVGLELLDMNERLAILQADVDKSDGDALVAALNSAREVITAKGAMPSALEELKSAEVDKEEVEASLSLFLKEHAALATKIELQSSAAETAQLEIREATACFARNEARKIAKHNLAVSGVALDAATTISIPSVEDPTSTILQLNRTKEKLQARLRVSREFVASASGGDGECPTCGTTEVVAADGKHTPVSELLARHQAIIDEVLPLVVEIVSTVQSAEGVFETYVRELDELQNEIDKRIVNLKIAGAALDALGDIEPEINLEEARTIVAEFVALVVERDEVAKAKEALHANNNRVILRHGSVKETVDKLQLLVAKDVDLEQSQRELETWMGMREILAGATATRDSTQQKLNTLISRKHVVEDLLAKVEGQIKYRALLADAQRVFHRDNLPALIAKQFTGRITRGWNEMLELFEVPFSAELVSAPGTDDDLSMNFHFVDGTRPSYQLSGGEKCAAALSLLVEVNKQFARNAGVLFLDEPTYGLNATKMDLLPEFLRKVQDYATATGIQIFMVTHEERLFQSFDNVINTRDLLPSAGEALSPV